MITSTSFICWFEANNLCESNNLCVGTARKLQLIHTVAISMSSLSLSPTNFCIKLSSGLLLPAYSTTHTHTHTHTHTQAPILINSFNTIPSQAAQTCVTLMNPANLREDDSFLHERTTPLDPDREKTAKISQTITNMYMCKATKHCYHYYKQVLGQQFGRTV